MLDVAGVDALGPQGVELQVQRLGAVRILVDSFRMWLRPSSGSHSLQDFERSLPRDGENKRTAGVG